VLKCTLCFRQCMYASCSSESQMIKKLCIYKLLYFTALPGKPDKPSLREMSVMQTSMVVSCSTNELGQPPINIFVFGIIEPIQRYTHCCNVKDISVQLGVQHTNRV